MAKKIIILERLLAYPTGWRFAMWADVPIPRQPFYVRPLFESRYKNVSAGELADLRAGIITEDVGEYTHPDVQALSIVKAAVEALFSDFQNAVTNNNYWSGYGSFFDGTTWTNGGVE